MQMSLVEESNNGRDCMHVSQSTPSASDVRLIDPTTDNDHGAEPCDHFSIRGYVAQVRKKDRKICSPFAMFHDKQSDEDCNLQPPLPVTKFRRWDCQNCLHKASVSLETITDGALCRIHSAELSYSSVVPSHADDNRSLDCFQQLSGVKNVVGRLANGDRSINEGLLVPGASHDSHIRIQNHSSEQPIKVSNFGTEAKTCQMGSGEKREDPVLNYLGTSLKEKILEPNSKEAEDHHEVVVANPTFMINDLITISGQRDAQLLDNSGMKKQNRTAERESKRLLGGESNILKNDPPTTLAAHASDIVSEKLHGQEMPIGNVVFPECTVQDKMDIEQEDVPGDKFHRKKPRKVRLLTDIVGTKEFGISGKVCTSGHGTVSGQSESNINRRQHASKRKGQHLVPGVCHTSGEVKVNSIKRKKKYKSLESEDDESSLICWLKRTTKKVRTCKEEAESKHTETVIVKSISSLDKCARKDTNMTSKQDRAKERKEKASVNSLRYAMPHAYLTYQSDILSSREGHTDAGKSLISLQNIQNNVCRKNLSKKNKKGCPTGPKESSQIYLSKVSLGNCELKNMTGFHGERIARKRKVKWKREKEGLDDIPMDIVELLAKKQHERHLKNDKVAFDTTCAPSEITEFMKDSHVLDDTEGRGRKEVSGTHMHYPQQKSARSNRGTGIPATSRHFGERLNSYHFHTVGKEDKNMHNENLISATGDQNCLQHKDHPSKEMHLSTIDSKKKCIEPYHSSSRIGMQKSQSCHIDHEFSGQRPFKNVNGEPPVVPGNIPFGSGILKAGVDCSHVKSFESNSLIELKVSKVDAEISTEKNLPLVTSLVEGGNMCHPKLIRPSDLYANDTIPAMHLLRLMDSSKWPGFSHYESPSENQLGLLQKPNLHSANQCRGFLNTECRAEISAAMKHPFAVECDNLDLNQQSSSKPFRPLPRIGILGSLLQKEITNLSDDCGTQSGYKIGQSDGHICINRKNSECSSSANYPAILTAENPILKHRNSEQHFALANYVADTGYCPQRDNVSYFGTSNKEKAVQSLKSCITMDICVVNRNPADFTIIDKDNEFMIKNDRRRARSKLSSGNLQCTARRG